MMGMTGAKAHIARLKYLSGPGPEKLVGKALFVGADRIAKAAQISITSGAVSGAGHVASKPGEAPNADTHDLANRIETTMPEPLVAQVSSNSDHAMIEWDWGNVAARPYMRPARDKMKGEVVDLVQQALKVAVKRSRSTEKD
jgi:hypothetical protein